MKPGDIGRRVAYWRTKRGFTQADLAHLMGQSRRWVQDLEGGQRQQDPRLSVLQRAASVLRIPLEHLITDSQATQPTPHSALPPDVAKLADSLHHLPRGKLRPVGELQRRVHFCCRAWAACHYAGAARDLPNLLADAHVSADNQSEVSTLLSRAYQLSASLLFKYGSGGRVAGILCADRALEAAHRSGDPVAIGAAARRVARGLIHQQRHEAAAQYAVASAEILGRDLERATSEGLTTLGMLNLVAALAITENGRSPTTVHAAQEQLDTAADIGGHLTEEDADFTGFGPTNVQMHHADALLRLDDAYSALEIAQRIRPHALRSLARHGHHVVGEWRYAPPTPRRARWEEWRDISPLVIRPPDA